MRGAPLLVLVLFTGAAQAAPLVLNEIEINPEGVDSGAEWVEILNVSDDPVDLAGWTVSYAYRGPGTLPIVDDSTILAPGERFVFVYPRLSLRNAEPDAIQLIDPAGLVVDEALSLTDTEDDGRTWQRFPDGGDPLFLDLWLFLPATREATND